MVMTRAFNPYDTLRTEPDMRQELINTLDGAFPEIAKKQQFVLRKMQSANNKLVQCPCVDTLTGEPDRDHFCPVCMGEGVLWEETLIEGYQVVLGSSIGLAGKEQLSAPGNVNLRYSTFYFAYDLALNIMTGKGKFTKVYFPDKIVLLTTDASGSPVRPYQRERIYRIGTAIDFRSDNAKIEYWKIDCYEEQVKFLNSSTG
jgi:hypothetical protein